MNMVKTLDKQITISHAQRADAPQGKIFKLQEYQKKRINKWIGSDSLEHYGDETQYIVEAIADTIYAFRGSSECPVRGKHTRSIYLSVFSSPSNTLKPTLFIHQQAPELRKETSLLFFGHLNQHLQAFHTDPPG